MDRNNVFRPVCSTCLSSDRNLNPLHKMPQHLQIFKLLMDDFGTDHRDMSDIWTCWECLAMMRRVLTFKWKVHTAQDHLRRQTLSHGPEAMEHSYPLTTLAIETKSGYDEIIDSTVDNPETDPLMTVKSEPCDITDSVDVKGFMEVTAETPLTFVQSANIVSRGAMRTLLIEPMTLSHKAVECLKPRRELTQNTNILKQSKDLLNEPVNLPNSSVNLSNNTVNLSNKTVNFPNSTVNLSNDSVNLSNATVEYGRPSQDMLKNSTSVGVKLEELSERKADSISSWCPYTSEYMNEVEMMACREEAKKNFEYISSEHRCETCLTGFSTKTTLEEHLSSVHTAVPGLVPCKICGVFVTLSLLHSHTHQHHLRYTCKTCAHTEPSCRLMQIHVKCHKKRVYKRTPKKSTRKLATKKEAAPPTRPPTQYNRLEYDWGKTTVDGEEGYKCLECGLFFKKWSVRRRHIAREHSEGLECDHCKKRFLNKTSLIMHLSGTRRRDAGGRGERGCWPGAPLFRH